VVTYKDVVSLPEWVLEDSLWAARWHMPQGKNKLLHGSKFKNNEKQYVLTWHLLEYDLAVLSGGLAGAGAVVVPLGQLAGISDRAGQSLHQPTKENSIYC
jgi:hypothetical protein